MKINIFVVIYLFVFSFDIFAQAQKHEIQLTDEKGKACFSNA